VLDEDSPHEPDEFDPVERWGDPSESLPEVPSAPEPEVEASDVDPELQGLWWRSVALANVAVGGVAVGLMVVAFRGMWTVGLAGILLGLFAAVRVYHCYRAFQERGDGKSTADGDTGDGDDTRDDGDDPDAPPDGADDSDDDPDAGRNA
jgi:hypothetical protein